MSKRCSFTLRLVSEHLGADVEGLDLADFAGAPNPETLTMLRTALDSHLLLRFPGQRLTARGLVELAALFGPVRALKRQTNQDAFHVPEQPAIKVVSNERDTMGRPLGDGDAGEQGWHADGTYLRSPSFLTFLYARRTPAEPPKTFWMNMLSVYAGLPRDLKRRIAPLSAYHYSLYNVPDEAYDPAAPGQNRAQPAGTEHPLVQLDSPSHRPFLFLPGNRDTRVSGLSARDSRDLLDHLWSFAEASPCTWGAALEIDDLVVWKNRATLHRREAWAATESRVLWHVTADGEVPTAYLSAA